MARKITQKELKHDEFVEAGLDFGHWIEEHWQTAAKWLAVGLLAVVAFLAALSWSHRAQAKARVALASAIDRYDEAQSVQFADRAELESIIDELARIDSGDAGMISSFYRGSAYFQLGRFDDARSALSPVAASGSGGTLGATAGLMLARTEWAAGNHDEAMEIIDRMIADATCGIPGSQLLVESGRLLAERGETASARERWQRVIDEFPDSAAAVDARRLVQ